MMELFVRARLWEKRRTKLSNGKCKSRKCTKALFELTNDCKKTIDKRYLIDQSVIKAAIFARSSCTISNNVNKLGKVTKLTHKWVIKTQLINGYNKKIFT